MKRTLTIVILTFLLIGIFLSVTPLAGIIHAAYVPPANNRVKLNFNYDWKFIRLDLVAKGTPHPEAESYDDSAWQPVSLPHCFNDIDRWREWMILILVRVPTGIAQWKTLTTEKHGTGNISL